MKCLKQAPCGDHEVEYMHWPEKYAKRHFQKGKFKWLPKYAPKECCKKLAAKDRGTTRRKQINEHRGQLLVKNAKGVRQPVGKLYASLTKHVTSRGKYVIDLVKAGEFEDTDASNRALKRFSEMYAPYQYIVRSLCKGGVCGKSPAVVVFIRRFSEDFDKRYNKMLAHLRNGRLNQFRRSRLFRSVSFLVTNAFVLPLRLTFATASRMHMPILVGMIKIVYRWYLGFYPNWTMVKMAMDVLTDSPGLLFSLLALSPAGPFLGGAIGGSFMAPGISTAAASTMGMATAFLGIPDASHWVPNALGADGLAQIVAAGIAGTATTAATRVASATVKNIAKSNRVKSTVGGAMDDIQQDLFSRIGTDAWNSAVNVLSGATMMSGLADVGAAMLPLNQVLPMMPSVAKWVSTSTAIRALITRDPDQILENLDRNAREDGLFGLGPGMGTNAWKAFKKSRYQALRDTASQFRILKRWLRQGRYASILKSPSLMLMSTGIGCAAFVVLIAAALALTVMPGRTQRKLAGKSMWSNYEKRSKEVLGQDWDALMQDLGNVTDAPQAVAAAVEQSASTMNSDDAIFAKFSDRHPRSVQSAIRKAKARRDRKRPGRPLRTKNVARYLK